MIVYRADCDDANFWFAAEEMLSETCDQPVFLLWSTVPTVMVGNFQNIEKETDPVAMRERGVRLTRRRSGGGAIYTDPGTFQYTYWIPGREHAQAGFAECSAPVLRALREMGLNAEFSGRNDILADGCKISGTARYVTERGIVHHGSLLFDADKDTMAAVLTPPAEKLTAKGIDSVRSRIVNIRERLPHDMTAREFYGRILEKTDDVRVFSEEQLERIRPIRQKFSSWEWVYGNNPEFRRTRTARFAGGTVSVNLVVKHGCIENVGLEGDFFADGNPESFRKALCGCRQERAEMEAALKKNGVDPAALLRGVTADELFSLLL